jgi:hypothetical protein
MYFVIRNSDGDTHVDTVTAAELKRRLDSQYYGEDPVFKDRVHETDTNYWDGKILIIRGEAFVPKAVQRVTEWDVP